MTPGEHTVTSRAFDRQGNVQPAPDDPFLASRRTYADLFSFGAVLYEMLTGRRAFADDTASCIPSAILGREPPPISSLRPGVPAAVGRLVARCLRKDPAERYQDAAELLAVLEPIVASRNDRRTGARRRGAAAVVAATLAAIALAILVWPQPAGLRVERTQRVTFEPELELDSSLSPDGTMLAYAGGLHGETENTHIFVRTLAAGDAVNLTSGLPGSHRWPKWSPDGTTVAFVTRYQVSPLYAEPNGDAVIHLVPARGGTARALPGAGVLGHAWSPDGRRLAYASSNVIYLADLEGGTHTKIADAVEPHSLSWSPDGRWIAYVSGNPEYLFRILGNQAPAAIAIVPAAGGEPRQLTDRQSLHMSPVWTPDSKSVLFASDRGGTRDIFELDVSESGEPVGEPRRVTTGRTR